MPVGFCVEACLSLSKGPFDRLRANGPKWHRPWLAGQSELSAQLITMASAQQFLKAFDGLLQPERFKDYGPNGLQVEGKQEVRRLVSGVTASRALIEAAVQAKADAIFVHHGLFWRGQDGRVTGWLKQR